MPARVTPTGLFFFPAGWVATTTRHKGETCQIHKHRSRSILAIEPDQRVLRWELIRREIPRDCSQRFSEFLSIAPVAAVAKTAEPVVTVRLANGCACTNHLPAFAASVARGTHLIQSAKGWRQLVALG